MNLSKSKKKMYTMDFLQFKKEMYNTLERNVISKFFEGNVHNALLKFRETNELCLRRKCT